MRPGLLIPLAIAALATAACGEGAPSIPHAIASQADTYCLSCHQNGQNGAPRTPHPQRTNCTGCHQPNP